MKHMHDLRRTLATQFKSYTIDIPLKHHQCYHHRLIYILTPEQDHISSFQINSSKPNIQ